MSESRPNPKRFINMVKRLGESVHAINFENALHSGMRNPKIVLTLVQTAPADAHEKYLSAKFYLSVEDAFQISDVILRNKPTEQKVSLFEGYQGGSNKKRNCIEARVLRIGVQMSKAGKPFYTFAVENCVGVQKTIKNGEGQSVPGVVMPATGKQAKVFAKNSYGASREEALFIANMLRMELQAWRNVVNTDMFYHPEKYRYDDGMQQYQAPPTYGAEMITQPPTAGTPRRAA